MIQQENEMGKSFGYISSSSDSSRKMECRAPFGNMSSSNWNAWQPFGYMSSSNDSARKWNAGQPFGNMSSHDSAKNRMHGNLLVT